MIWTNIMCFHCKYSEVGKILTGSFQTNGSIRERKHTWCYTLRDTSKKMQPSPHNLPRITHIPRFWIQLLKVLITSTFLIMGRLKILWPQFYARLTLGNKRSGSVMKYLPLFSKIFKNDCITVSTAYTNQNQDKAYATPKILTCFYCRYIIYIT